MLLSVSSSYLVSPSWQPITSAQVLACPCCLNNSTGCLPARELQLLLLVPLIYVHSSCLEVQVEDLVMAMDETLRPAACTIAAKLRAAGRRVDVVLESKRLKWAFKVWEDWQASSCEEQAAVAECTVGPAAVGRHHWHSCSAFVLAWLLVSLGT